MFLPCSFFPINTYLSLVGTGRFLIFCVSLCVVFAPLSGAKSPVKRIQTMNIRHILLSFALLVCSLGASAREVIPLNEGWRFFFKSENTSDRARYVNLPHSWNTNPATEDHLLETIGNYVYPLYIPADWAQKRIFIKFYGVQSVADLFVNGAHIGNHLGASAAFTFELTDRIRFGEENQLLIAVSNNSSNDFLPTGSDMNFYGGIYRPVELIITERTAISPLYLGTDGILVHPASVTPERASGNVEVHLTSKGASSCRLRMSIASLGGEEVYAKEQNIRLDGRPASIPFTVDNPRLWSPSAPELYNISVALFDGDKELDRQTIRTGFRAIETSAKEGVKINGERLDIRGVTLYHDNRIACGSLTRPDYDNDLEMIEDVGANAIRSAVMPHYRYLYDECDERGLVAWIDIPFHNTFMSDIAYLPTPKFEENGIRQLSEIVAQNMNHPSVIMWGIFSRLNTRGVNPIPYIRRLDSEAKALDPSRPTVACSDQDGEINFITTLIVWQQNVGWNRGSTNDLIRWKELLTKNWSHLKSGVSYGGQGLLGHKLYSNTNILNGDCLPEDRLTRFHEGYVRNLGNDSLFWGRWVNSMFDYGSVRRPYGVNAGGLVDLNHRDKKDIYYLYRAVWNKRRATLHLADKHNTLRANVPQTFRVYSSAGAPTLTINADTVALTEKSACQYVSEPQNLQGEVRVRVSAGDLKDSVVLNIGRPTAVRPTPGLRQTKGL